MTGTSRDVTCGARDPEAGSATVVVVGLVAVVVLLAGVVGLLGGAERARQTAGTAADLAALAGAASIAVPVGVVLDTSAVGEACDLARAVAHRNGAPLTSCSQDADGVVQVTAVRSTAVGDAVATARAGPRWVRDR
ncbi:MAG: histidine kinase [Cellulomonadaceae bacterium]|nr:histidine kinase [Cellulomonadaceae bacterium]